MDRNAPYADPVTIANGASLSGAIDIQAAVPVGISMPAAWTAANLTFAACDTLAGTYLPVYDAAGTEVTVQADAARWILLDPADFAGVMFLKVRSGTVGTPVNQGAARIVTLAVRRV